MKRATQLTVLSLLAATTCWARPRLDLIRFENGDHLRCEIVKLERGYLYVSMEQAEGTISLDWTKIAGITSPQSFVVEDSTGRRFTGSFEETRNVADRGRLVVTGTGYTETLQVADVVLLEQTDASIWRNLHGSLNMGLNFTKQERRTQYNFSSSLRYAKQRWSATADYESSFAGGDTLNNLRNNARFAGLRQVRSKHNYATGVAELLQDSVQGLDLRLIAGGAFGRLLRNENTGRVAVYAGMIWNQERYTSTAPIDRTGNSLEGLLGLQLNFFKFKTTNFLFDSRVYPGMTETNRVRWDLNTSARLRIAKNLYWNLGFYLNYDSRPPQGLPKSDYGSTGSLGWSF